MSYYYDGQIERYILQFMAVFSEIQVEINKQGSSEKTLIDVPIHYGSKDRVSAAIFADHTVSKPIRVPTMSANLIALNLAPENRKGIGVESTRTYLPVGDSFPDGLRTVRQLQPIPYTASMDLTIFASNQHQHMQILEYIMLLFDYEVQIQTSDNIFDRSRLTTIAMENILFSENYPMADQQRIITTTVNFRMDILISSPADVRNDVIHQINAKVALVDDVGLFDFILSDDMVEFTDVVSADVLDTLP